MSFECHCCVILAEGDPGVTFVGGDQFVVQPGARLFPLSRIKERLPLRVELKCTRPDEHPLNGSEHWHETPSGYRMTWKIPEDAIWLAGSAQRRSGG